MVTYGSYMKKEDNIENCVKQIEIFDTGVAFLAGLVIIPAVFTFNGDKQSLLTSGPSLMFITLPKVFSNMRLGWLVGIVFFILVFFAALTSSISLMETIVAMVEEKTGWKRVTACIVTGLFSFALALPSALGFGALSGVNIIGMSFLDFFDFISNSVLMPIVALLMCIFVGYFLKTSAIAEEISESESFKRRKLYDVIIKYVAPVFLVIILITSILSSFKIISL